jgi:hypothetical protein
MVGLMENGKDRLTLLRKFRKAFGLLEEAVGKSCELLQAVLKVSPRGTGQAFVGKTEQQSLWATGLPPSAVALTALWRTGALPSLLIRAVVGGKSWVDGDRC